MWWLFLLGVVTLLVINRRRLLKRIVPLDDELYSTKVAVDHVHSGVAWIRSDGRIGSLNVSLASTLSGQPTDFVNRDWLLLFPAKERNRVREGYSQALISGIFPLDTQMERSDGSLADVNVRLVTVHDHKMRFVGHYCMAHDKTREKVLEAQVQHMAQLLERKDATVGSD